MRLPPLLLIPALLVFLTGCFQREVRLIPNPDGSGILEIRTVLSDAFLRYAEAHAGLPPDQIWFHKQALVHAASTFGKGVEYLEHRIEAEAGSTLFLVRYRFDRVSDIVLEVDLNAPFLFRPPTTSAGRPPQFRFEHEPGLLRILPPDLTRPASESTHVRIESAQVRRQRQEQFARERRNLMERGNPFKLSPRATPEEIVSRLARDMHTEIRILFPEGLQSGNARFLSSDDATGATEILLFSFSGDDFLESAEHVKRLAEQGGGAFEWHDLPRLPGVQIDTGGEILLRF